jgi:hypothetical protein
MQWSVYIGLVPFFLSAALAIGLIIIYRKVRKIGARRSPLADKKIGHIPGQQLVARMSDHETDMILGYMLMCMAFPLMFLAWAGKHIDLSNFHWGVGETIFLLAAIALFASGFRGYQRNLDARDKVRDGLLAERVTGMQLNRLVAKGCKVLHDLPCEGFNIDHVVVAPRGVYAVETKSFRKPKGSGGDSHYRVNYDGKILQFPDFPEKDALAQAERQAQWLRRTIRESIGGDVPVTPALALPGWMIVNSDEVWKTAPVKVFSPMGDGANFMAKDIQVLDEAKRNLIAQALALRYPATE